MMTIVRHIILIFAMGIVGGHGPMTRRFPASSFPFFHNAGQTLKLENMSQRLTLDEFIRRARAVHGDKYDYTQVDNSCYKNSSSKIPVVCKIHGRFNICVSNHLIGQGCPICANIQRRLSNTGNTRKRTKLVYGVGHNDYDGNIKYNKVHIKSYRTWVGMLKRCYSVDFKSNNTTYADCTVCDEWLYFSNFKKWFDDPANGYRDGYQLDKDILVKGNKIYSPDTCCFVPFEINVLLCKSNKARGKYPIGVFERKTDTTRKYGAYLDKNSKHVHLGYYETVKDAFNAYKEEKERYLHEQAMTYYQKKAITYRVYYALQNYKVEIND